MATTPARGTADAPRRMRPQVAESGPWTPETVARLRDICGADNVLSDADELLVYERDAYPLAQSRPAAVIFPTSTAMARQVLALLYQQRIPFVPRGAGTSLVGGCLATPPAACVSTERMRRILHIDVDAALATVEAGVVTQNISDAVADQGFHYAPDPSSQTTCTIGGNVATNAGGPHTLKYGVTARHVLELTVVLPHGEILRVGGQTRKTHGYNLKSLFLGSEGTLGLITEVTVQLSRRPPAVRTILAVYDRLDDASASVGSLTAAGIIPAALEMIDQAILNILEDAYAYGFPRDAEAILLIEIDGLEAGLDRQLEQVVTICRAHHARRLEHASTAEGRALLWTARKTAFGALGRLAYTCMTQDGVVPPSKLAHILRFVRSVAAQRGLQVASQFHAGDGNIHPNFLFDRRDPQQVQNVLDASHEILAECVRVGGSVSGEHGIGVEKIAALKLMFNERDLAAQQRLRDVFDPLRLANPHKVFECEDRAAQVRATGNGDRG